MGIVAKPGDVLVVHDPGFWPWVIRLGPFLHNLVWHTHQPDKWNHVAVMMPDDAAGNHWCIEGRPGGVGWRDPADYLNGPLTLSNVHQPKTDGQREQICAVMQAMADSRTPYDWPAIAVDILNEVDPLWSIHGTWGKQAPAHVVCSSAADLAYERVGLASPKPDRYCTPWDWAAFDERAAW